MFNLKRGPELLGKLKNSMLKIQNAMHVKNARMLQLQMIMELLPDGLRDKLARRLNRSMFSKVFPSPSLRETRKEQVE